MSLIMFPVAADCGVADSGAPSDPQVAGGQPSAEGLKGRRRNRRRPYECVSRRGSVEQGRALETLGHAVEYLVDSRMFLEHASDPAADQQAVQILMRASRAVFADCPEVISLGRRLKEWLSERLSGDAA